ncbi:SDR family oxidoreductase [Massilia sp. DD77]|uniref:SDR family oxidoreductase n=1 Tax=Massilia sp. DD77 TaxID=3109349 RepID=UPI003000A7A1
MTSLLKDKVVIAIAAARHGARAVPASDIAGIPREGGVVLMAKALADALGLDGIRVNAVAPGTIDTRLLRTSPVNNLDRAAQWSAVSWPMLDRTGPGSGSREGASSPVQAATASSSSFSSFMPAGT